MPHGKFRDLPLKNDNELQVIIDGELTTVERPEPGPCDHCGPTDDEAECACGCSGYEDWCGCIKCYVTHWPTHR